MALIHDDAQSTASTASTGNTTKCAKTCLQLSVAGLVAGVLDADLRLGAGLVAGFTTIGVAGFTTSGSALSANFFRFGLFAPRAQHHCGGTMRRTAPVSSSLLISPLLVSSAAALRLTRPRLGIENLGVCAAVCPCWLAVAVLTPLPVCPVQPFKPPLHHHTFKSQVLNFSRVQPQSTTFLCSATFVHFLFLILLLVLILVPHCLNSS